MTVPFASATVAAHGAPVDEHRWRAVLAKDRAHDGEFVFAVRTTGVFCKPSCPARAPRRENVAFFDDAAAARRAGFRACLRCKPEQPAGNAQAEAVARACRLLEAAEAPPSLGELADAAGLSRYHFLRVFKRTTGLTPMAYQRARRRERVGTALPAAGSVTAAIYDAGFGSSSRFYAEAGAMLGMSPAAYRKGGEGESIRFATAPCALGTVLVAATRKGVCAIEFGDAAPALAARLEARFPRAAFETGDGKFARWVARVVAYVDRPRGSLDLPLDVQGTAFQQRVWDALRRIPAGETASYAAVAQGIGRPDAARAVAQACASNPVAIAVPCHRVVRGDGGLGGYRWGLERKRELLAREGAPLSAATSPARRDPAPAAAAPAAARPRRATARAR